MQRLEPGCWEVVAEIVMTCIRMRTAAGIPVNG